MTTNSQKTREKTPEENFRELYKRTAQLNDKVSALLNPAWGSEMGIIPTEHPLYRGKEQSGPAPADDGPCCVCGDPIEQTGDPAYWIHSPGSDTPCTDARPKLPPMDPMHILGIKAEGPPCIPDHSVPAPCPGCEQAPAADEDAQRTTDEEQTLRLLRRESLLVLLTRLQRGRSLSDAEAGTLRQHVETEIREADTARLSAELADAVTAETKRLLERRTTTLRECAERAEAAIERVREVADRWDLDAPPPGNRPLTELRAALDGTEQPTTEA